MAFPGSRSHPVVSGECSLPVRPQQGWLRAAREARGLPRRVVAEQLGVSDAAVRDYELAEVRDTISLCTFRRVAKVLGCDLMVALVPASVSPAMHAQSESARPIGLGELADGEVKAESVLFGGLERDGGELAEHLK